MKRATRKKMIVTGVIAAVALFFLFQGVRGWMVLRARRLVERGLGASVMWGGCHHTGVSGAVFYNVVIESPAWRAAIPSVTVRFSPWRWLAGKDRWLREVSLVGPAVRFKDVPVRLPVPASLPSTRDAARDLPRIIRAIGVIAVDGGVFEGNGPPGSFDFRYEPGADGRGRGTFAVGRGEAFRVGATGDLTFDAGGIVLAVDMTIHHQEFGISAAGRAEGRLRSDGSAEFSLRAGNSVFHDRRIEQIDLMASLTAQGPLALELKRLVLKSGDARLEGKGTVRRDRCEVSLSGEVEDVVRLWTNRPSPWPLGGRVTVEVSGPLARLEGKGRLRGDFAHRVAFLPRSYDIALSWDRDRLGMTAFFLGRKKDGSPEVRAEFVAEAGLDAGTGEIAATVKEVRVRLGGAALALAAPAVVRWKGERVSWTPVVLAGGQALIKTEGLIEGSEKGRWKLQIEKADVGPLLLEQYSHIADAAFRVSAQLDAEGGWNNSLLEGRVDLRCDRLLYSQPVRLDFRNMEGRVRIGKGIATLDRASGYLNEGLVTFQGHARIAGVKLENYSVMVKGTSVYVAILPFLDLWGDFRGTIVGKGFEPYTVKGDVVLEEATYNRNFSLGARVTDKSPAAPPNPRGFLERVPWSVRITGKQNLQIENNLANVECRGEMKLAGVGPNYRAEGTIDSVRGYFKLPLLGTRFRVMSGRLTFDPKNDPRVAPPTVAVEGRARRGLFEIVIVFTGPGREGVYQRTMTSIPPLPEEDILSVLVTGQTRTDLLKAGVSESVIANISSMAWNLIRPDIFGEITIEGNPRLDQPGQAEIKLEYALPENFFLRGERDRMGRLNLDLIRRFPFR
ncbi:MAG: translocation/assembly module TamB domain-containing protein [Planctomycetota bacterium]